MKRWLSLFVGLIVLAVPLLPFGQVDRRASSLPVNRPIPASELQSSFVVPTRTSVFDSKHAGAVALLSAGLVGLLAWRQKRRR